MESTLGAVFSPTEFSGSNTCALTSDADNVPMDEFCAIYRQRRGLPNISTSINSTDRRTYTDHCPTNIESEKDQNVKQKEESKSVADNALMSQSRRRDVSRSERGEKRCLEENTTTMVVKKQKLKEELGSHAWKMSENHTMKGHEDKTENVENTFINGERTPNTTIDKQEEESHCSELKIVTDKEYFRQSIETAVLQFNNYDKEEIRFLRELNAEPVPMTLNVYMVRNSALQQMQSGGTAIPPHQPDHGCECNTVNLPPPLPNEETITNGTMGEDVTSGEPEQAIQDLQDNTIFETNEDLQHSVNVEDDVQTNEVCQSTYPVRNPNYEEELARTASFIYWKNGDQSSLVEAGFFYTGDDDIVRCFHCGIGIGNWDLFSDPWTEHARFSPDCPFLNAKRSKEWIANIQANWNRIYKPKHPEYQLMETRLKSFESDDWCQNNSSLSPDHLAEAGFFLEGDCIRCHYCDGIPREDGSNDGPWLIHAKTFPFCKFVQRSKGSDFIKKSIDEQTEIERPGHYLPVAAGEEGHVLRLTCVTEYEIREERNLMWTAAAQSLLEIGHDRESIKGAIKAFISRTGRRDFNATDLLDIIQEYEEALLENEQLRNRLLCKSCRARDVMNIILDCGHLMCEQCAAVLVTCAICDSAITERVRIYT